MAMAAVPLPAKLQHELPAKKSPAREMAALGYTVSAPNRLPAWASPLPVRIARRGGDTASARYRNFAGLCYNGAAVKQGMYRIGSVTVLCGESRADSPAESSGKLAEVAGNERGAIAATASAATRAPATAPQEDASRFCPACSQRLESRRCKLICNVCGYYMSCADYY